MLNMIIKSLSPLNNDLIEKMQHQAGLWPRLTIRSLLSLLSTTSKSSLPEKWKATIILLAQSLVRYQHSQRMMHYQALGAMDDFHKEYKNDPDDIIYDDSEWLLIQARGSPDGCSHYLFPLD